jgi:hypothetical protein
VMFPGTSPSVFVTLAVTGPYPNASSVGNVISVPLPTIAFAIPAPTPARTIRTA